MLKAFFASFNQNACHSNCPILQRDGKKLESGDSLDTSKNYFRQLKIAEDIDAQNSIAEQVGTKLRVPLEKYSKGENKCVCRKYNLVWGSKVSCEFRKKVVEIAKKLHLPQENNEGANWLMAIMALESARSFSPSKGNGLGYYGLIQFGAAAAKDLGTTTDKLKAMSDLEQLDYVEKFSV